MKLTLLRADDVINGNDIFRLASLFLYSTFLSHVLFTAYLRQLMLNTGSMVALGLLITLFVIALVRMIWRSTPLYRQPWLIVELLAVVTVIVLFTLQHSMSTVPLPWLIGVAGVFPLVITGVTAPLSILAIASLGFALNTSLHVKLGDWLPDIFATLLVGLLAVLLSKTLSINLAAISQARTNDRRFDAIARATRHVFMITDAQFRLKYANPALQEVIGYSEEEIERENILPAVHPEDIDEHQKKLVHLRNTPRSSVFSRHRTRHKNGQWVWLETSGYNMLHDAAINGLVFSVEDVSARQDAEIKLEEEHALLRAVLDLNPSMIYAKDVEGRFTISNLSFQKRFGYSSEDGLRGKSAYEIFLMQAAEGQELDAYEMADHLHREDLHVIKTGVALEDLEVQGFWESDTRRWYRTNKYPLRDAQDRIIGLLGITRDTTDRKEYEMRLERQALHDSLTGLPNRRYLLNAVSARMAQTRAPNQELALLFCDLDFFKSVNDTHGHDFGDKCLTELTRRIVAGLPADDFVARFGGNEFVVLTNATIDQTKAKADLLIEAVSRRLVIDNVIVKIQTSIGIAFLNAEHKTPSELIRDADAAMYQAKERGRNRFEIFDALLQNHRTRRAQMDVALRFALERNELTLLYQPKVSMRDGTVKGFELLLRWNSPEYGEISPADFIPIAETSGLVVPIGMWVLEQACRQLSTWQAKYDGLDGITVAVNVSMRQLLQSSFLADVLRILESTKVVPHSIELELTETSAMANPIQTIENLSMLKKLGLRLALDDFGTGYSSLAYLQKLPIDVLKIDKAFVQGLGKNAGDAEIVRLILALAQALNLETVAEGVETAEHISHLKDMGCFLGQGYIFSAPMTAAEAENLLHSPHRFLLG